MKVQYIRRDIPEEISEEGGAFIQLVNKSTVGLSESIKEAIRGLYCVGEASLIEGYFVGLIRSVFAGIQADGCGRCIGDIRFYPVCTGEFDLSTGWDPLVNGVKIHAQLLNGLVIDVTDWSFEDATVGRVSFKLSSLECDGVAGQVKAASVVGINGSNFPAAENLAVTWTCNGKSGTIAAAKLSSTCTRLDIAEGAISGLTSADDGKTVEFTVKGCYNKQTIKGVFVYVESTPSITKSKQGELADNTNQFSSTPIVLTGNFPGGFQSGDQLELNGPEGSTPGEYQTTISYEDDVTASDETEIHLGNGIENKRETQIPTSDWIGHNAQWVFRRNGVSYPLVVSWVA